MIDNITQDLIIELINYNPENGSITWRRRDRKWFKSDRSHATWNSRYSGKTAGSVNKDRNGYSRIYIGIFGKLYLAHRLAWFYVTGEWPKEIDHINRNPMDNSFSNLQEVSKAENGRNKSLLSNNSSGFTGVYWHTATKKWMAHGKIGRKTKYLGVFDTIIDAVAARMRFNRDHDFSFGHGRERPSQKEGINNVAI